MPRIAFLLIVSMFFIAAAAEEAPPRVEVTELEKNLYRLSCTQVGTVNTVALTCPEGILLVDTGYAGTAEDLKAALAKLKSGRVKIIINTQVHGDHVGGNELLGEKATVIAHGNVRERLTEGYYALPPLPHGGLPNVQFEEGLNDESKQP